MYGLILEGIGVAVKAKFGVEKWDLIIKKSGIRYTTFLAENRYSETIIERIVSNSVDVLDIDSDEIMQFVGGAFVEYIDHIGYGKTLRVLGRHLRDFLNGLDNLHEYLRFTYPRLKPPSFYCDNETSKGLRLHYRSRRKGFQYYVVGQIQAVARKYYDTDMKIEILSCEESFDNSYVIMQLFFNNSYFKETNKGRDENSQQQDNMRLSTEVFFEVFPFHVVFDFKMQICSIGTGISTVMGDLVGRDVDEVFQINRPLMEFTIKNVKIYLNNIFELSSMDPICKNSNKKIIKVLMDSESSKCLKLKGQMLFMNIWNVFVFLATPVLDDIGMMFDIGLYINDLSMHDASRDLVLAGTQQSAELKLALEQEKEKSKILEESMKNLDAEMRRTDELLYQMIPKAVADRLRDGEPAVNTCEVFENVTILFSDVVGFTRICSQITPMAVVSMLNMMYTSFDQLSEKNKVYKVETIGDAYMCVSGAPTITSLHALYVANMGFDMMEAMASLKDPATDTDMKIRIGIHSGMVVAGVVGMKMPRYCLFGNTVNTASRLESGGAAMQLHISETTKSHLDEHKYIMEENSSIEVKGIGTLETFWLVDKPQQTVITLGTNIEMEPSSDESG